MTYLFLGIALLFALILAVRAITAANPATLAQILRWSLVVMGGGLAVLLLVRGQALMAAVPGGLAAFAWRALSPMAAAGLWRAARKRAEAPADGGGLGARGGRSGVETAWLAMTLDHASGAVSGTVRQGRFAGRSLDALDRDALFALLDEVAGDRQSAQLLESYLDRVHGADWRDVYGARAPRGGWAGTMTRAEALRVLGLGSDPTPEQIKGAHRALMQKVHPDHGGSDYLAAKINQAKDFLLGG